MTNTTHPTDAGAQPAPAQQPEALAAIRTLEVQGYTHHGGEQWKPPVGAAPNFNLLGAKDARIAELEHYYSEAVTVACALQKKLDASQPSLECQQQSAIEEAVTLLRKYKKLCDAVGRGDSYHLKRIEDAAAALQAAPQARDQPSHEAAAILEAIAQEPPVNGNTIAQDRVLMAANTLRNAAPQAPAAVAVQALEWTDPTPPSDACRYDHVKAESPLGEFRIEWKGWKKYDSYCVNLGGHYLDAFSTLDEAKTHAAQHLAQMAQKLIPFALAAAPAQALDVPDEVDLPDVEDMAHSAVQEALSYGVSHDVFHRWMRAVMDKTVQALAAAPAQASDTESVLIDGIAYDVPAAVAGELLSLHLDLLAAAPAQAVAVAYEKELSKVSLRNYDLRMEKAALVAALQTQAQEHATQLAGQGLAITLSAQVREFLQEAINDATHCEEADMDVDFAEELGKLLEPIYAAPAQAQEDARDARWLEIGKSVERACEELPAGAEITISLERDAGTVTMVDWDGNEHEHFSHEDGFAGVMNQAIDAAIAADRAAQGGGSDGKAS